MDYDYPFSRFKSIIDDDPVTGQIWMTSRYAQKACTPQCHIDDDIRFIRVDIATPNEMATSKSKRSVSEKIGKTMGLSARQVRNIRNDEVSSEKEIATRIQKSKEANGTEITDTSNLHRLLTGWPYGTKEAKSVSEALAWFKHSCCQANIPAPKVDAKCITQLLEFGVSKEVMAKCPRKKGMYYRTGETLRWSKPQTLRERAAKALEGTLLLVAIDAPSIQTYYKSFNKAGLQHLCAGLLNPEHGLPAMRKALVKHDTKSQKRANGQSECGHPEADHRATFTNNFFVLWSLCYEEMLYDEKLAVTDPRGPLAVAVAQFASDWSEFCRLRGFLDSKGRADFTGQWDFFNKALADELDYAASLDPKDEKKVKCLISMGYGDR